MNLSVLNLIKEKAKSPYPMVRVEVGIYVANISLIIAGVALSFSFRNWEWFERFGSFIVIVGIGFAWADLVGKFNLIEKSVYEILALERSNSERSKTTGPISSALKKIRENEITEQTEELKELFELLRYRLRTFEAVTLILGTFIWGFGRVLGNLVVELNA
jgi:hypothetical protein